MTQRFRPAGFLLAVTLLLAACVAPPMRHGAPPSVGEPAAAAHAAAGSYRIDASRSELKILVYRAGPLARFGHNHVMVNRAITGSVEWGEESLKSVRLVVPAAGFIVDDPQARREEGDEFAGEIPDDARTQTLHNMLSAAVLDADEYPEVTVRSVAGSARQGAAPGGVWNATVTISIAGHESDVDVPLTLASDPDRLSASGSMELRQSALGLKPFSLMLGALQVQDALTIKFRIVAQRS